MHEQQTRRLGGDFGGDPIHRVVFRLAFRPTCAAIIESRDHQRHAVHIDGLPGVAQ